MISDVAITTRLQPDVSVIMPMRNAEAFVAAAARSVLSQEGVGLELIVVDDRSTDRSRQIITSLADPRVRVMTGPARGIAAAFNVGLEAARADVIVRCDADDLLPPGRLHRQLTWLAEHEEFGAICGGFTAITRGGQEVVTLSSSPFAREITADLCSGIVRTSFNTFAVRTAPVRRLGGCREFFETGEDVDLQLRLGEVCRVWYDPRDSYWYRLHDSSITHTRDRQVRSFYDDAARAFQRQRRDQKLDDLQRGDPPRRGHDPHVDVSVYTCADQIQNLLIGQAWKEHQSGRRFRSIVTGVRAVLSRPSRLPVWKSAAALVMKRPGT